MSLLDLSELARACEVVPPLQLLMLQWFSIPCSDDPVWKKVNARNSLKSAAAEIQKYETPTAGDVLLGTLLHYNFH